MPKKRDKDPIWRSQATYTTAEVVQLITDPRIPVERRVRYAYKALAGMRHGEVAALAIQQIDFTATPLPRINVVRAFNSAKGKIKSTKTEDTHAVPMHPPCRRSPWHGSGTGASATGATRGPMTCSALPAR